VTTLTTTRLFLGEGNCGAADAGERASDEEWMIHVNSYR
jgi:hypothetical protein